MPIPKNKLLYEKIKRQADLVYKKHSAYKSAYITKQYLKEAGEYEDDNKPKNLKRWFNEKLKKRWFK